MKMCREKIRDLEREEIVIEDLIIKIHEVDSWAEEQEELDQDIYHKVEDALYKALEVLEGRIGKIEEMLEEE